MSKDSRTKMTLMEHFTVKGATFQTRKTVGVSLDGIASGVCFLSFWRQPHHQGQQATTGTVRPGETPYEPLANVFSWLSSASRLCLTCLPLFVLSAHVIFIVLSPPFFPLAVGGVTVLALHFERQPVLTEPSALSKPWLISLGCDSGDSMFFSPSGFTSELFSLRGEGSGDVVVLLVLGRTHSDLIHRFACFFLLFLSSL